MLYNTSEKAGKFDAVFSNRIQYTTSIHGEVKEWVAANIARWKSEKPQWFAIELIPDNFLPNDVFKAEDGKHRRRSSTSFMEAFGLEDGKRHSDSKMGSGAFRWHPDNNNETTRVLRSKRYYFFLLPLFLLLINRHYLPTDLI